MKNFQNIRLYSLKRNKYLNRRHDDHYYKKVTHFRKRRFFRKSSKDIKSVNPKDPLNLLQLEKEQEERLNMGLSPLPGDSAFNTPIINEASDNNEADLTKMIQEKPLFSHKNWYKFSDLYNTNAEERLKYFLPDWFDHSNVCEYGCHRGEFAFKLFEQFHTKISRLDCIDVRKNCILNAKHLQREKYRCEMIRRVNVRSDEMINYNKINFKVGNWVKDNETYDYDDGCEYDIVIALGVTKLIHLYYGDIGLEKFLRRACHRLKPGGHLIVELQTKTKYLRAVKEISKAFIVKNFKNIKIQPDRLEPLLASVGFPYCCKINTKQWNKQEHGDILLCTKPIGTTPVPIRDTNTTELMLKYSCRDTVTQHSAQVLPPPVTYQPGSMDHFVLNSASSSFSTYSTEELQQVPDSTVHD